MSSNGFIRPERSAAEKQRLEAERMHLYAKGVVSEPYLDYGPAPPASYDTDKLSVLPIQPRHVFVYWELSGSGGGPPRQEGDAGRQWVIRGYGLDTGSTWDVDVDVNAGNYYVKTWDDSAYRFEIGFIENGEYRCIVSSEVLQVPWARRAGRDMEPIWAHFRRDVGPRGVVRTRRIPYPAGLAGIGIPGLTYASTKDLIVSPYASPMGRSKA